MDVNGPFDQPRLTAFYDTENSARHDIDFYLALAGELGARHVVDVGCGTGMLAVELAEHGHSVTGVDPSPAMLNIAKSRPGNENVRWIDGTAVDLPAGEFDLAIMTGHVAQVFLDDTSWAANLTAIHRSLKSSGHLAFESRDPTASAWQKWTPEHTRRRVDGPNESVVVWYRTTEVPGDLQRAPLVHFEAHHEFADDEDWIATDTLRFPSEQLLSKSLRDNGFRIRSLFGGWDRTPIGPASGELIYLGQVD